MAHEAVANLLCDLTRFDFISFERIALGMSRDHNAGL